MISRISRHLNDEIKCFSRSRHNHRYTLMSPHYARTGKPNASLQLSNSSQRTCKMPNLLSQSIFLHRYTLLNAKTVIPDWYCTDHENMGTDILFEVLAYTVKQISTNTGFSVMASTVKAFPVQSHTPDPAATHFFDDGGRPYQNMGSKIVALFT